MTTYTERHKEWYQINRTKVLENIKNYYLLNPTKLKRNQLKTRYNLTLERFNEMIEEQNNRCKICEDFFSEINRPFIDHDHRCCYGQKSCGKCIRSLLCSACNRAIGLLRDNEKIVNKAAEYLKEFSEKHVEG